MRHTILWFLLVISSAALVAIVLRQGDGMISGLSGTDVAGLIVRAAMLLFIAATAMLLFRDRLSQALVSMFAWVVIGLALFVGYTYRFELRDVADRMMAELVPGRAASRGRTVEIARGTGGSFTVMMQINGARIPLALDTGASSVVLTQEAAKAAGLPIEVLSYTVNVDTANGRARAAPVSLDRITVGSITERSVAALIAQPGQLKTNLLGMSFLNRLESWEVRGDRLIMRAYP
jgi:aspartyl protease family protein